MAGGFFACEPLTLEEHWRATAELRMLTAMNIELGLPPDTPPEYAMMAGKDEKGELKAFADYDTAAAVCIAMADQRAKEGK